MSEKYLTFDCYGTLLQENNTYDEIEKIALQVGVDPSIARQRFETYQNDSNNVHPYLDYDLLIRNNLIHLDYQFGLKHQFEKYFVDVMIAHQNLVPFPETIKTLKTLVKRDYHLIVMSNSSWDIIDKNVQKLEVPFDIWTAEDVHAYKPDLHFFETVEKEYGFTSQNHWHLAEGYESDIISTDKMGWPSIWVNRSKASAPSLVQPTHTVSDLTSTLEFLN